MSILEKHSNPALQRSAIFKIGLNSCEVTMFQQIYISLLFFTILLMITGCSTIFTAQEWSENYALMDGVQSTSSEMIDGNLETIGEAPLTSEDMLDSLNDGAEFVRNDSIVIVSLPEKKRIYRIILHSDNLRHFVIYIDKGRMSRDEDWHRVTEMEDVRTSIIDLKLKIPHFTDKIKIRIIKEGINQIMMPKDVVL